MLKASVIIANYNSKKFIKACLESLIKSSKVTPIEVIVIDNNSTDGSKEYLKKLKVQSSKLKVQTIFNSENLGPAKARNIGAKIARGKFLVFLDCDTVVDKNWLKKPIKFLEQHKDIGAAQLKILKMGKEGLFDSAGEKLTRLGFLSERARGAKDIGQFDYVEDIFSGKTAAMIVRSDLFQKIGGFDEDLFMYWEEPDLCWRIWKSGHRVIFLPTGKVWHAYGTKDKIVTQEHSTWITYQGCRNQITTIIKNGVGLRGLRMLITAIVSWIILLLMFLIKLDLKKAKAVLSAFWWLLRNHKILLQKRKRLKKKMGKLFNSDPLWFPKIEIKRGISWYFGKGISFVLEKPF